MPKLIAAPTVIAAAGNKPKQIEEFIGRVNSGDHDVSIARMKSPPGWVEPGQRPEFQEISVVLNGMLRVEHENGAFEVPPARRLCASPASGCATELESMPLTIYHTTTCVGHRLHGGFKLFRRAFLHWRI